MLNKVVLALCLTFSFSASSLAQDNTWLVGVWQLDSGEKVEYLEFDGQNGVTLISDRGRKVSGDYELADNTIKIVYNFKGKKIPIELSISAGKNALQATMSNTGKSVKYTKNA